MFGPCCIGDCCGPGSYCCQHAGPHSHDEIDEREPQVLHCTDCGLRLLSPPMTVGSCPACDNYRGVMVPEQARV